MKIRVSRALDWLSSTSVAKMMGQKPTFQKKHHLPFQAKLWPAITRQLIELESCSNPLMT